MRNIEVLPYDKNWENEFLKEKEKLEEKLGDIIIKIFHAGSTSVENLFAKPVIDIILIVENIEELDKYNKVFEEMKYEVMGEYA